MRNSSSNYFDPVFLGKKLKEVSVDLIRTENQNVTSRWYHARDADVFIWQDENQNIIKQQISFSGQIIEWNVVDGVRTGLMVEEEPTNNEEVYKVSKSEIIRFDTKPSEHCIQQARELLNACESIEADTIQLMLFNLNHRPSLDTMTSKEIFDRYKYLKKPTKSKEKGQGFFAWLFSKFFKN